MSKPTPHQLSELLEKNKQLVRNFINDVLNRHDISAADRYFAQDPKPFKEFLRGFFQRFPDSHTTIDHILAEDDKVLVMMSGTATDNQTGKQVTIKAADLFRIENSMFVEHWDVVDRSGMA
jgi:predicted SnoaL-like aldol condensation-catalyzing enzyme